MQKTKIKPSAARLEERSSHKRWLLPRAIPAPQLESFQRSTRLPAIASEVLIRRGITSKQALKSFLFPSLSDLHDPFLLKDMDKLVDALVKIRSEKKRLAVHGDYDVDGLTGTTLLTKVLRKLDFEIVPVVPHREKDGYGLSLRLLSQLADLRVEHVLTCDVGISAYNEVAEAKRRWGMNIYITDHHEPPHRLPKAEVIVNPKISPNYPFSDLAGVGVAYKVVQALLERLGLSEVDYLHEHLDLAALGTVCDVVPLVDENRVLAYHGLQQVRVSKNIGLRALYDMAGLALGDSTEASFAWVIGPRLNSVGRLDSARKGLELLLTDSMPEALKLAKEIEQINKRRRDINDDIEASAVRRLEEADLSSTYGIVLVENKKTGPPWHPGVIGIVASRLVERFGRPVFMFASTSRGELKGSGRSPEIEGVNLYEMLHACAPHLTAYGGHAAAAGASITKPTPEGIQSLTRSFDAAARAKLRSEDLVPLIQVDLETTLDQLSGKFYGLMRRFAPFGAANSPINMLARGVTIRRSRAMGKNEDHLKLRLEQNNTMFEAIGFRLASLYPEVLERKKPLKADIVFQLTQNSFEGLSTLQLEVLDLRLLEQGEVPEDL